MRLIKQRKINQIYDRFTTNITHELKSPLASIQLASETLQKRGLPDDIYFDILNRIEQDAYRQNQLIESILEISKINKRKDFFTPVSLPADEIVRNVSKDLQNQFCLDESNLSVIGYSGCHIMIDPSGLTTVLSNLIDNSIKYSKHPVKIKIKLANIKKKFILTFSDEGIGVSDKERKRVFYKFIQLQKYPNTSSKGFGLGLYWCREILKIHKGKIIILKSIWNTGTSFRIELPAFYSPNKSLQGGG